MSWFCVVVVVTHEGPGDRIRRCLDALHSAGGCDAVVVVDNSGVAIGPTDPRSSYGPGVQAVVTMPNLGYGAAANAGLEWATEHSLDDREPVVVLVNDDVVVGSGWLAPLLDALGSDDRIGAVQPKILLQPDALVNSVGVEIDRYHAGSDVGFREPDGPDWSGVAKIDVFSGGAVVFRRAFLHDLGGFDERFFLYYEDVDLALRGAARGWRYLCQRDSVVDHEFGASTSGLGDARLQMQERNRLWVAARHGRPTTVADALWLSVRRLAHPPRRVDRAALLSGVAGMPARMLERCGGGRR